MLAADTPFVLLADDRAPARPLLPLLLVGTLVGSVGIWAYQQSHVARVLQVLTEDGASPPNTLAHCDVHVGSVKAVVCLMDHSLVALANTWKDYSHFREAMLPYWTDNFTYIPMHGLHKSQGLHDWFDNEMETWSDAFPWVSFQQMLFLGSGGNASSATVAVGTWERQFGPLAPTGRKMTVRITDFYRACPDGRIERNWMMIDMLDLLRQQGVAPLPLSPLPQGRVSPPQGDSIPAPLEHYVSAEAADDARRLVSAMLQAEWVEGSLTLDAWSSDMVWYGPVPFGLAMGGDAYRMHFLRPLVSAFAERALSLDVFTCEGDYCGAHGTFSGAHRGEWLGHAPSGVRLALDFGMHWHVRDGQIVEGWAIFDLPKMFRPLGVNLLQGSSHAAPQPHAAPVATASVLLPVVDALLASREKLKGGDNECSNAYASPPPGPAALDCPAFVIRSTDETWHPRSWAATNAAVDVRRPSFKHSRPAHSCRPSKICSHRLPCLATFQSIFTLPAVLPLCKLRTLVLSCRQTYFAEDWQSVRAFGLMLRGREALREFMADWLGAFPDVFIHVADVFCLGNDEVGYKTTMPYVLTATHTGTSKAFGAPTGRAVKYHGIANCYIQRDAGGQWQYTREWDLPDMWAFTTAMNLSSAQLPHPAADLVPVDECKPLFEWGTGKMNWFPAGDR